MYTTFSFVVIVILSPLVIAFSTSYKNGKATRSDDETCGYKVFRLPINFTVEHITLIIEIIIVVSSITFRYAKCSSNTTHS